MGQKKKERTEDLRYKKLQRALMTEAAISLCVHGFHKMVLAGVLVPYKVDMKVKV